MNKIILFVVALAFISSYTFAQYSKQYDSLQNKMAFSFAMGKYQQAIEFSYASLDLARKEMGETHIEVGNQYCNIGLMLKNLNKFDSAYLFYEKAESFFKLNKYTDTTDFMNIYLNRSNLSTTIGRYDTAYSDMNTALTICSRLQNCKNSNSHLILLNNLAGLLLKQNKNREAEKILLEAVEVVAFLKLDDQLTGLGIKNTLAICYIQLQEYQNALKHLENIEPVFIKKYGLSNGNTILIQSNMFLCYYKLGNKSRCDELGKSLHERASQLKDKSPAFPFLNNYANMLAETGQLQESDRVYNSFLDEMEKIFGVSHPECRSSRSSQTSLLFDLGQYDRAYAIGVKVMNSAPVTGRNNYFEGLAANNFLTTLVYLDSLDKAIELGVATLKNLESDTSNNIQEIKAALSLNLAGAWHGKGNNKKSLEIMDQAIGFVGSTPSLALIVLYQQKGNLLAENKQFLVAISTLQKAIAVVEEMKLQGGRMHRKVLFNMIAAYTEMGQITDAIKQANTLINIHREQLTSLLDYLTPGERELLVSNTLEDLDYLLDFYLYAENKFQGKYVNNFVNVLLFREGLLLKVHTATRKSILQNNDTLLLNKYKQLQELKVNWIYQMQLPPQKQMNTDELAKEILVLEKEIQSTLKKEKEFTQDWKTIASGLQHDEAYIHYYQAGNFVRKKTGFVTSSNELYAIVIKRDAEPELIKIDPEKKIAAFFNGHKGTSKVAVSKLYSHAEGIGGTKNSYQLLWQPLEKFLTGVKTIYLRTNGDMNRISFASLPLPGKQFLIDKYVIRRLIVLTDSSFNWTLKPGPVKDVLLIGDVDFNSIKNATQRTSTGPQWESLPSTRQEITTIQSLLQEQQYSSILLTDSAATENAVKNAINTQQPNILHIATHGFFTQKQNKPTNAVKLIEQGLFSYSDLSYMQSGIVLSGANKYETKTLLGDDGILNAYEIESLNFQKTELVVMSACETALGNINLQEGVYGLQRAFKIAGVKCQLLSLWIVPDKETRELMIIFYNNIIQGKTYEESLIAAQLEMKKKYDPYYWAGFVLFK